MGAAGGFWTPLNITTTLNTTDTAAPDGTFTATKCVSADIVKSGTSASVSAFSTPTATITGLLGMSASSAVRLYLNGAASSGNNSGATSSFPIVSILSDTSCTITNASAVAGDANNGSLVWSTTQGNIPHGFSTPGGAPWQVEWNQTFFYSYYVKLGANLTNPIVGASCGYRIWSGANVGLNLLTGVFSGAGSAGLLAYGASPVGNGWYRVWMVATKSTNGFANYWTLYGLPVATLDGVLGVQNSVAYCWGAQVTRGANPSVYRSTSNVIWTPRAAKSGRVRP